MTGKTHFVVGEAAALAVLMPSGWKETALCFAAAAVGSVICDIDVDSSHAHRQAERVILFSIIAVIIAGLAEWKFDLGITQKIVSQRELWPIAAGIIGFLAMCMIGKEQPHRSFMHSLLAVLIFSGLVYLVIPEVAGYFAVAMSSHLVLDIFNKKNIRLWYPFPGGVSLKLCKADGWADEALFYIGCTAASGLTLICLMR